jgi:hypothetical protein
VVFFLTARRRNPATVVIPGLSEHARELPGELAVLFPFLSIEF